MIPVSQPRVTDLHIHDGEPLRFKASFEIMPEIKVEGYKELRADHPEITSSRTKKSEQALNSVREQHATFTSVEGRPWPMATLPNPRLTGKPVRSQDSDDGKTGPTCPHGRSADRDRRQEHGPGVHREPSRCQRRRREIVRSELSGRLPTTSGLPARRSFTR
jgi:hypothetical protein